MALEPLERPLRSRGRRSLGGGPRGARGRDPRPHAPAVALAGAGLLWSAATAVAGPQATADQRVLRMHSQLQSFRYQLSQVERAIFELETE